MCKRRPVDSSTLPIRRPFFPEPRSAAGDPRCPEPDPGPTVPKPPAEQPTRAAATATASPQSAGAVCAAPRPGPDTWQKRHRRQRRPILPIDLRLGQTVALLIGNLLAVALVPTQDLALAYVRLLSQVLRHEIMAKPGRHYPRRGTKYSKKKTKGNRKAQYERRKRRKQTTVQQPQQPGAP